MISENWMKSIIVRVRERDGNKAAPDYDDDTYLSFSSRVSRGHSVLKPLLKQ